MALLAGPLARLRALWPQLWRFGLSGVGGLAVDVLVLYLALGAGLGYFLGRALSFLCAVWATWQLNRRFTFHAEAEPASWRQWWQYLAAMSGGGAVNYGAYSAAVLLLPRHPLTGMYAVAIGSLAGMTLNFIGAKWLVFRRRRD